VFGGQIQIDSWCLEGGVEVLLVSVVIQVHLVEFFLALVVPAFGLTCDLIISVLQSLHRVVEVTHLIVADWGLVSIDQVFVDVFTLRHRDVDHRVIAHRLLQLAEVLDPHLLQGNLLHLQAWRHLDKVSLNVRLLDAADDVAAVGGEQLAALDALTQDALYVAAREVALAVDQVQAAPDFLLIPQQFLLIDHFDPMNEGQGPNVPLSEVGDVFGCLLLAFPVGEGPHLVDCLPHFNVLQAVLESRDQSLAGHVLNFLLHYFYLVVRRIFLRLFGTCERHFLLSFGTQGLFYLRSLPFSVADGPKSQPFFGFTRFHVLFDMFGVVAQIVAFLRLQAFVEACGREARFFQLLLALVHIGADWLGVPA
jgi:hypothetical protein